MRVVADASLLIATLVDSGRDGRWARSRVAMDCRTLDRGYGPPELALAEALDCPLLTLDRRLSRSNGPTCEVITPPGTLA